MNNPTSHLGQTGINVGKFAPTYRASQTPDCASTGSVLRNQSSAVDRYNCAGDKNRCLPVKTASSSRMSSGAPMRCSSVPASAALFSDAARSDGKSTGPGATALTVACGAEFTSPAPSSRRSRLLWKCNTANNHGKVEILPSLRC